MDDRCNRERGDATGIPTTDGDETAAERQAGDGEVSTPKTEPRSAEPAVSSLWRKETHPYLMKLAARIEKRGVKNHSISLPIGVHRVLVSPKGQQLVLTCAADPDTVQDHESALVDSICLQVKMLAFLRTMSKDDELNAERHKRRLARERDLAYLVSRRITLLMRQLRDDGNVDEADILQESRHHLQQAIVTIENVLGTAIPTASPSPKDNVSSSDSNFVYDWQEICNLPNPTPTDKTPAWLEVARTAAHSESKDRSVRNRIILVLVCIVLAGVLLNLWVNRQHQLPDFAIADFKEVPGIEQVVNRSPTLLIVVNEEEWDRQNVYEKRRAVKAAGTLAKSAGYHRAEFRSVKTPYLAVWHRSGEIEISK